MVISGGNLKPDTLKPKEVVSLLLDDDEIESKCKNKKIILSIFQITLINTFLDRQKQEERRQLEETRAEGFKEKDRKRKIDVNKIESSPKVRKTEDISIIDDFVLSPRSEVSLFYNINKSLICLYNFIIIFCSNVICLQSSFAHEETGSETTIEHDDSPTKPSPSMLNK